MNVASLATLNLELNETSPDTSSIPPKVVALSPTTESAPFMVDALVTVREFNVDAPAARVSANVAALATYNLEFKETSPLARTLVNVVKFSAPVTVSALLTVVAPVTVRAPPNVVALLPSTVSAPFKVDALVTSSEVNVDAPAVRIPNADVPEVEVRPFNVVAPVTLRVFFRTVALATVNPEFMETSLLVIRSFNVVVPFNTVRVSLSVVALALSAANVDCSVTLRLLAFALLFTSRLSKSVLAFNTLSVPLKSVAPPTLSEVCRVVAAPTVNVEFNAVSLVTVRVLFTVASSFTVSDFNVVAADTTSRVPVSAVAPFTSRLCNVALAVVAVIVPVIVVAPALRVVNVDAPALSVLSKVAASLTYNF